MSMVKYGIIRLDLFLLILDQSYTLIIVFSVSLGYRIYVVKLFV